MRCEWRQDGSTRYLATDYRGCASMDEMLEVLEETRKVVEHSGGAVRLLLRVTENERPPSGFLAAVKRAQRTWLRDHEARVAVVGVGIITRTVLRGVQLAAGGHGPLAFPDEASALRYLGRA